MATVQRLTRASDFAAARREGRSWSDSLLVLIVRRNGLCVSRVGYSVSKRAGNAVARNRIKRRLREAVRSSPIRSGWDLVFIARKDVTAADFHAIERSVTSLIGRAAVVESTPAAASHPSEAE
jgi:ribonuclease P protein component